VAVETGDIAVESGDHVVQFYERDSELVAKVGPYLTAAARGGEVAIVIATEAHRLAFEVELEAEGIDLVEAGAEGRFLALDAAETVAAFMVDGRIDHDAFHEVVGGLLREAVSSGRAVRAYGEMVALLWDAGDVLAAIELETLWNDLARDLTFSLFCAYPAGSVSGSEHADALHKVCHLHSSVFHPATDGDKDTADRPAQMEVRARFAAEREAPGRARRLVVAALRQWGHDDALVDDAALVLSELATNAVLHAGTPFSVAARLEDATLRIAVQDGSQISTTERNGRLTPRTGHGLGLIEALSASWGVESVPGGKVVWAQLRA
jgi:anti-sigma regulatory factor (Ser/Thr protein kinase)